MPPPDPEGEMGCVDVPDCGTDSLLLVTAMGGYGSQALETKDSLRSQRNALSGTNTTLSGLSSKSTLAD